MADGIANLKRALNHRLLLIEELYKLKNINFLNKPKGYLELLEKYELVRPFIMKELLKIRNEIEHNDKAPPSISRCNELLDIVWYFLKTTDNIVQMIREDIDYTLYNKTEEEYSYVFSITLDWENHRNLKIAGWFPNEYVSSGQKGDSIKIILNEIHGKEKCKDIEYHKDRLDADKWIIGQAVFEEENYYKFLKEIFKCI